MRNKFKLVEHFIWALPEEICEAELLSFTNRALNISWLFMNKVIKNKVQAMNLAVQITNSR